MSDRHVAQVVTLFEEVAAEYDQHVPFFRAFADRLVEWVDVQPGERVLDIGTGRGAVAEAARSRGAVAVGLDLAAEMLRRAPGPRLRADGRRLPVRGGGVDLAVGAFSIHLLPDPVVGLREAARVVRSGGKVVLAFGGRFASSDWDFWFETLARHASRGTRAPTLPAPTPIPDPVQAFRGLGLVDVRTAELEIDLAVEEPRAFLRGEQAHGSRSFFDRFEPAVREEVETELLDHLERLRRDGGIRLRRSSTFVEGRVP
jgi:SAM-dependent methyltransferase